MIPPGLRPEAQILLSIGSVEEDTERASQIRAALKHEVDWGYFLRLCVHNRVLPLAYRNLKEFSGSIPEAVRSQLEDSYNATGLRNLTMTRTLLEILDLLESENIQTILLKGPSLALDLYGKIELRHFWDLDLLVPKNDVRRVKQILLSIGFEPERRMEGEDEDRFLETDCEYNFDRQSDHLHVEVHWQTLPRSLSRGYDADRIIERARAARLVNRRIRSLPPEELLIYLCIHGGEKHQWYRLKWICDIAQLIDKHKDLEFEDIIRQADDMGRSHTVRLGLFLATVLLGAPLADNVFRKLFERPVVVAFAGLVQGRLFREDHGLPGYSEWTQYMAQFRDRTNGRGAYDCPVDGLTDYLRVVMAPEWTDVYGLSLPTGLSFLYYLSRPIRLYRKHRGRLLGRLR